jgi:hypothetical protein
MLVSDEEKAIVRRHLDNYGATTIELIMFGASGVGKEHLSWRV